jgi:flagellar hook protein FlgE
MGVNATLYIGASGLQTFANAMSMVSDNIANANTAAFKGSHARFGDMVSSYLSTQSVDTDRAGCGSAILGVATNFAQGPLQGTDTWSDLSINGEGFFNVHMIDDTGNLVSTAQTYYTRDGSFHVDKTGFLVNNQGFAVLGMDGAPIKILDDVTNPTYTNFNTDASGQIFGTPVDPAVGVDPVLLGTVRLSKFPNQDGLVRQGANLFLTGPESGAVIDGTANAGGMGTIIDCNIEGSNVDLASEMVSMIIYQADFNANSKSVTTGNSMLDTVINMVR